MSKAVSRTMKSIPSRGKLVDKYRNKRRQRRAVSTKVKIAEPEMSHEDSDDEGISRYYT